MGVALSLTTSLLTSVYKEKRSKFYLAVLSWSVASSLPAVGRNQRELQRL